MPNACWNTITIYGQKELLDEIEEYRFSFQHFVPMPEVEAANWFDWKVKNWGTRWDAHDVSITVHTGHYMYIVYTTATKPPNAFLETFLEKYPTCFLKNTYHSEDGSAGVWVGRYKNGEKYIKAYDWEEMCLEEMLHTF